MYMTVYDLSPDQLDELKSAYFWSDDTQETIYGGDGLPVLFPGDIPDDVIYREYDGTLFVNDDFACSAGQ